MFPRPKLSVNSFYRYSRWELNEVIRDLSRLLRSDSFSQENKTKPPDASKNIAEAKSIFGETSFRSECWDGKRVWLSNMFFSLVKSFSAFSSLFVRFAVIKKSLMLIHFNWLGIKEMRLSLSNKRSKLPEASFVDSRIGRAQHIVDACVRVSI